MTDRKYLTIFFLIVFCCHFQEFYSIFSATGMRVILHGSFAWPDFVHLQDRSNAGQPEEDGAEKNE